MSAIDLRPVHATWLRHMSTDSNEVDAGFLAWAKANAGPDDHALMAQALESAREQCRRWQVRRGDVPWATERVGTEVQETAIAKCVATYLADPKIPDHRRCEQLAVYWVAEAFGVSERTVRYAVAKRSWSYQLEGRSSFLVNGVETPYDVKPPAEWSTT
jgi:hypothetical protein